MNKMKLLIIAFLGTQGFLVAQNAPSPSQCEILKLQEQEIVPSRGPGVQAVTRYESEPRETEFSSAQETQHEDFATRVPLSAAYNQFILDRAIEREQARKACGQTQIEK